MVSYECVSKLKFDYGLKSNLSVIVAAVALLSSCLFSSLTAPYSIQLFVLPGVQFGVLGFMCYGPNCGRIFDRIVTVAI